MKLLGCTLELAAHQGSYPLLMSTPLAGYHPMGLGMAVADIMLILLSDLRTLFLDYFPKDILIFFYIYILHLSS